jgi:hypothetical protein
MTIARAHLVDVATTRWYHCVTRCVRRAFLLAESPFDRNEWIDRRRRGVETVSSRSLDQICRQPWPCWPLNH